MSDGTRLEPSADAWLKFMDDVVLAIRLAVQALTMREAREREEKRRGWFGKPRRDYGGTRFPDETAISRAIVRVMRGMRARQFIAAPALDPGMPDLKRMEFNVEADREEEEETGLYSQPTDIQIAIHGDGLDLRIEAKKLLAEREIEREYLGKSGLERFDDAKAPYTLSRMGGMIAYVMDRDADTWRALIDGGMRAKLPSDRLTTTLIAGEQIRTTQHMVDVDLEISQVRGRFHIDVIHMVFEFEARPAQRLAAGKWDAPKPRDRSAANPQADTIERRPARRARKQAPTSKDA